MTKEQKFSALDSFADRYDIDFQLQKNKYCININKHRPDSWHSGWVDTADQAMTAALRYLRRINKAK